MEVVLVDLDLQFGDVASTLDLAPQSTIEHALRPDAASDNLVLKTMLTVHPAGFFVLLRCRVAGGQRERHGAQITSAARPAVDAVRLHRRRHGGRARRADARRARGDRRRRAGVDDGRRLRARRAQGGRPARELGLLPASRTLALNLADRQSGLKVKDVEAVVGLPVDVVIPRSSDVQLAANHGEPLMLRIKEGRAVREGDLRPDRAAEAAGRADASPSTGDWRWRDGTQ